MGRARELHLVDRVHGEAPRPLEPALVAGAFEQRQEGETVAGRAVAERRAFAKRPRLPGQLASGHEQPGEAVVAWRHPGQRRHDPGSAVAPLRADLGWPAHRQALTGDRLPVRPAFLRHGGGGDRAQRVTLELAEALCPEQVGPLGERGDASGHAVCRADELGHVVVEVLGPDPAAELLVLLPPGPDRVRELPPDSRPARLARALQERGRDQHRAGRAPHHLDRRILGVRREQVVEQVAPGRVRRQSLGDRQDPGAPEPQAPRGRPVVGKRLVALVEPGGDRGEVALRAELVKRPDDARSPEVDAGE